MPTNPTLPKSSPTKTSPAHGDIATASQRPCPPKLTTQCVRSARHAPPTSLSPESGGGESGELYPAELAAMYVEPLFVAR